MKVAVIIGFTGVGLEALKQMSKEEALELVNDSLGEFIDSVDVQLKEESDLLNENLAHKIGSVRASVMMAEQEEKEAQAEIQEAIEKKAEEATEKAQEMIKAIKAKVEEGVVTCLWVRYRGFVIANKLDLGFATKIASVDKGMASIDLEELEKLFM